MIPTKYLIASVSISYKVIFPSPFLSRILRYVSISDLLGLNPFDIPLYASTIIGATSPWSNIPFLSLSYDSNSLLATYLADSTSQIPPKGT